MASDAFITFRGEPDVLVEYKTYHEYDGVYVDWWFRPEDAARFGDVTAEEDEAVINRLNQIVAEDRYEPMDGDVSISLVREPGEPLGTPLSEISGRPGHDGFEEFCRIAKTYGYD